MEEDANCILIASNFANLSPYWLQIKFFKSLFSDYLLLRSIGAPEICRSRRHCSACQQSRWYSM